MPETNTLTIPLPRPTPPKERYLNAARVHANVESSGQFRTERELGTTRQVALAHAAQLLAEQMALSHDVRDQKLAHLYNVLSKFDDFVHSGEGLAQHQSLIEQSTNARKHQQASGTSPTERRIRISGLPAPEVKARKSEAVEFNHAIRALLNHDPTISFSELVSFLADIHKNHNLSRWTRGDGSVDEVAYAIENRSFKQYCEMVLRGMQHEIFAKTIIDSLAPDFSCSDEISVEDDLKGADLYVTYKGVTFPVDIKASMYTVRQKRQKSRQPQYIIWSGIESKRVGGRFRLTVQEIKAAGDFMRQQLLGAYEEYTGIAQARGSAVLRFTTGNVFTSQSPVAATSPLKETPLSHSASGQTPEAIRASHETGLATPELLGQSLVKGLELIARSKSEQRTGVDVYAAKEFVFSKLLPEITAFLDTQPANCVPSKVREELISLVTKRKKMSVSEIVALRQVLNCVIRDYQTVHWLKKSQGKFTPTTLKQRIIGHDIILKGHGRSIQYGLQTIFNADLTRGFDAKFKTSPKWYIRPL